MPEGAAKIPGELAWGDVAIFLDFLEAGHVAATARQLGLDETTVARRLRRFGQSLGCDVLETRDHRLVATEAALALSGPARAMADAADHLLRASRQQQAGPSGRVRVTAIRAILNRLLLPRLHSFRAEYPDIELDLMGDSRNFSLPKREADIAIRLALPNGNELVTRKLADVAFAAYAPKNVESQKLPWIGYTDEFIHLPEAQWLERHRGTAPVALRGNGIEMLVAAARQGLGRVILPCFAGDQEVALERLGEKPVLLREAWLAVHSDDRRIARVRAVMDLIIDIFEQIRPMLIGQTALVRPG
jgi:DNA-binding transcriptional LysR family regulator